MGANDFDVAIVGLVELDTIGGKFMWSCGAGPDHTQTCLDRVFASMELLDRWLLARLLLLHETSEDAVLCMELLALQKGTKLFKFYNSWLQHDDFNDKFHTVWAPS